MKSLLKLCILREVEAQPYAWVTPYTVPYDLRYTIKTLETEATEFLEDTDYGAQIDHNTVFKFFRLNQNIFAPSWTDFKEKLKEFDRTNIFDHGFFCNARDSFKELDLVPMNFKAKEQVLQVIMIVAVRPANASASPSPAPTFGNQKAVEPNPFSSIKGFSSPFAAQSTKSLTRPVVSMPSKPKETTASTPKSPSTTDSDKKEMGFSFAPPPPTSFFGLNDAQKDTKVSMFGRNDARKDTKVFPSQFPPNMSLEDTPPLRHEMVDGVPAPAYFLGVLLSHDDLSKLYPGISAFMNCDQLWRDRLGKDFSELRDEYSVSLLDFIDPYPRNWKYGGQSHIFIPVATTTSLVGVDQIHVRSKEITSFLVKLLKQESQPDTLTDKLKWYRDAIF